jgi:integrase
MAAVTDTWHVSRPKDAEVKPCTDHPSKTLIYPSVTHGKGRRWQVRYRDANGQQKKESYAKKSFAEARAAEVENDLNRGQFIDRTAGKESFRAVAERWRTSAVHHRPSSATRVERALRLHVYPAFGDRPIGTIQRSEIRAWIKERAQVLAPSTLSLTRTCLVAVLRTAVQDGIIRANPCDGVRLPPARRPEVVPLVPEVVRALIDAAPSRYRALVLLAAASGLRQGEVFGLEVGHIDFLRRTVRVEQQMVGPEGGKPFLGEPKTHQSHRTVPLVKAAVDALAAHLAAFPAAGFEIEDRTNPRKPRRRKAQLVFTTERGGAIQRRPWARVWAATVKEANKALAESGSEMRVPAGATMHDLRHFYASLLIKHGESVKTVQKRLGHAQPSITLNTYTHLWPDEEDTTRAAVEAVLGDVPPMCPPRPGGVTSVQVSG